MEVTTALGVISFGLISLLGVFPLGLENSRTCVGETRAAQLLAAVSSTLVSEPFTAAPCFSSTGIIDLSLQESFPHPGQSEPGSDPNRTVGRSETLPVVLYASYDASDLPHITREMSPETIYKIELRFRSETFAGLSAATVTGAGDPPVVGSTVLIRVTDIGGWTGEKWSEITGLDAGIPRYKRGLVMQTQTFIPAFSRVAYLK